MNFQLDNGTPQDADRALVVWLIDKEALAPDERAALPLGGGLDPVLDRLVQGGDFQGSANEIATLYPTAASPERVMLVGLGERDEATLETVRRAAGAAARRAQKLRTGSLTFVVTERLLQTAGAGAKPVGRALLDAAALAAFRDLRYGHKARKKNEERVGAPALETIGLLALGQGLDTDALTAACREARAVHRGVTTARLLGNLPGNDGTPTALADAARDMAEATGLRCQILDEEAMEKLGMGALLGVAMGSATPARFIILEHQAERTDEQPVVLIGKGVTFDTGGISIKGSASMEEMKFDMCGGAAVIGAMEAIARLGLQRRVIGLVPAAENMPSAAAQRPGDIRTALDGQTIEIINTDAEGRLLLADAIAYACDHFDPAAIVDLATLTGGCIVALGRFYAGLFTEDDDLLAGLRAASASTGERIWQLPLDPDFDEMMKSDYADVKNSGGRWGSAITAAAFLKRFVRKDVPWAHLDIAGTAWTTKELPYHGIGATGFGVRLLVEWLSRG